MPTRPMLGSFNWVQQTQGVLTFGERWRLFAAMFGWSGTYASSLLRLKLRLVPPSTSVNVLTFRPPVTAFTTSAQVMCGTQTATMIGHAYRTWLLGLALAKLDGQGLDDELFYGASLLHDFGLMNPSHKHDFTLVSADAAIKCAKSAGLSRHRIDQLADAICVHPTIGVSVSRNGPLGYYLQWGAMADVAATRRWKVGLANLQTIQQLHPCAPNFKAAIVGMIHNEARSFRGGRFALYVMFGMTLLIRISPAYP